MNAMPRVRLFASILIVGVVLFFAGCGGTSSNSPAPPAAGTAPVSLTIGDTPPTGVTVLSFEVTVTGAVLQPGDASLLSKPVEVEITKLETETALLNTASAPAGTYNSIAVTFANPELTILNNSGGPIGACANGAVCELKPSLSPASVTYSAAPFPLTLSANSSIGLLLDFNLNTSIQSDLSINPAISFSQLPTMSGAGQLEELEDVAGQVTGKDAANNQFTLQTSDGQSFTIKVDTNTKFEDFDEIEQSNSFSSLAVGQNVEVDLSLIAGGTLLAEKVELESAENNEEDLQGTIVSVDSPTEFKMVVLDEVPDIAGVQVGNLVTVTIQSGAAFRIHEDGLSLPPDVSFNSSADLLAGQNVQVRRLSASSSGTSVTTDRVSLRMSQFTAKVKSTSGNNFLVNNLSSLFAAANPPITEIQVFTTLQTEFDHVSSVPALAAGNTVSLRGSLFGTSGIPELVAKKLRKR